MSPCSGEMTECEEPSPTKAGQPCQEELELEELFRTHFTEDDVEYTKTINTPLAPPPCVSNWYIRPKRTYDWSKSQGGRDRGRGQGHRGGWQNRDHNRQQDRWDRGQGQRDHQRDQGYHHGDQGRRDQRYQGHGQHQYGHGNQGYGHGNRSDRHGHDDGSHGRRDDHVSQRVHYAGMKQTDGSHSGRQHYNSQPYERRT